MEEIMNINGTEYIKRELVKDMENELAEMKKIMSEINKLSFLNNIPTDTTTRHTQRVNNSDNDRNFGKSD